MCYYMCYILVINRQQLSIEHVHGVFVLLYIKYMCYVL